MGTLQCKGPLCNLIHVSISGVTMSPLTFIFFRPLSMSDNLTKLAHKIDFSTSEEEATETKDTKKDLEEAESKDASPASFQPPTWPWDSVRNKLRYGIMFKNSFSCIPWGELLIQKVKAQFPVWSLEEHQWKQRCITSIIPKASMAMGLGQKQIRVRYGIKV